MTYVTCRLTAKYWDQLRNPTLGSRVWATFTLFICGFGLIVFSFVLDPYCHLTCSPLVNVIVRGLWTIMDEWVINNTLKSSCVTYGIHATNRSAVARRPNVGLSQCSLIKLRSNPISTHDRFEEFFFARNYVNLKKIIAQLTSYQSVGFKALQSDCFVTMSTLNRNACTCNRIVRGVA